MYNILKKYGKSQTLKKGIFFKILKKLYQNDKRFKIASIFETGAQFWQCDFFSKLRTVF